MAGAQVFAVLTKIAAALGGEALGVTGSQLGKITTALLGIENSMQLLQTNFNIMLHIINQQGIHSSTNDAYDTWVNEVKKVAHNAEDVIDEYTYLTAQTTTESCVLKQLYHHSKNICGWCNITTQLKQIEARLQNLKSMKDCFSISVSEQGEGSIPIRQGFHKHLLDSAYFNTEDDIVGHREDSEWLMKMLMDDQEARTVISIYGMGGIGKTTLARGIYKKDNIKQEFDCFAWISVSQSYQDEDLLRRILRELQEKKENIDDQINTMDTASLVERVRSYLQNKRYLIVLDDMWSGQPWMLLNYALVENNKRSRVIITTRNEDVTLVSGEKHRIQLSTLEWKDAWDLFCRKAFCWLEGKRCPQSVTHWAEKILDKCKGLPLAIAAIGSLLSFRSTDENGWKLFHDALNWHLINNPHLKPVIQIINLSFDDLSNNLKNCFLYCSLFPEDYLIPRSEIIRLWIAEGFVEERGANSRMEEVAEEYLTELAQRSLLQVVWRNVYGRAKYFQMHDLVRNITITKCKSDKFSVLVDDTFITKLSDDARRMSILKGRGNIECSPVAKKIRSFILFDQKVSPSWIQNALSNFRLLRVLSLRYANIEKLPDVVTSLFNLQYLDLYGSKVKEIPMSLCRLRELQMLDLRRTGVVQLPNEIKMLTKLRYLRTLATHADSRFGYGSFDPFGAAQLCSEIYLLKDLQKLGDLEASNDLVASLGKLTQLRCFLIRKVRQEYVKELCASINKMRNLVRLGIVSYDEDEIIDLEHLGHIPNLEWMHLRGKLQGGLIPSAFSSFSRIRVLEMAWSRLQVDPLPSFSHMFNLARLDLDQAYDGEQMTFRADWFPKLKELGLARMEQLSWIEIEAGMQTLTSVYFVGLRNMKVVPPGFRHLPSLPVLHLGNMPEEFVQQAEEEGFSIVNY